jgi:hypothetical protein
MNFGLDKYSLTNFFVREFYFTAIFIFLYLKKKRKRQKNTRRLYQNKERTFKFKNLSSHILTKKYFQKFVRIKLSHDLEDKETKKIFFYVNSSLLEVEFSF